MYNLPMQGEVVWCSDQDVVHVDEDRAGVFQFEWTQFSVHDSLESAGGVTLSEKHHQWFKESKGHFEGCLPLITFLDVDVVIPSTNIELGEQYTSFQVSCESMDVRQWVDVTRHPLI